MLLVGLSCCLLVVGCMSAVIPESIEHRLARANNDLAFDLLKVSANEKNVFISPFSISKALDMLYLGAEGSTAEAMRHVLKYDKYGLSKDDVNRASLSLLTLVTSRPQDYQLSSYNSALVRNNFTLHQAYEQALRQYYSAVVESVNFATQGEQIKQQINANVERETRGKIKDFLDSPPSPDTILFLLNAVYFLGSWKDPFHPSSTFEGTFYNDGVHETRVQFMSRDGEYSYNKNNDLNASVVVLPYKGNHSASLVVVLPNARTGINDLEQRITQDSLDSLLQNTRYGRIDLFVPKFSLKYSSELSQKLTTLGLGELFTVPDLSGIAGVNTDLKVSKIVHKAVIDVDEKGTEAAAATGVEIVPLSLPPQIRVDHPFLFFIRDNDSGTMLFAGRVNDL